MSRLIAKAADSRERIALMFSIPTPEVMLKKPNKNKRQIIKLNNYYYKHHEQISHADETH